MKEEKRFQAESKELLHLMIHSIYSNKEIFLRELISNASDAIDKYRYLSVSSEGKYPAKEHEIFLSTNAEERYIQVQDNGIGMSKEDLEKNLGTIAKSGIVLPIPISLMTRYSYIGCMILYFRTEYCHLMSCHCCRFRAAGRCP